MRLTAYAALVAVALAGCGGHAVQLDSEAQPVGGRWNGLLSTPARLAGVIQVQRDADVCILGPADAYQLLKGGRDRTAKDHGALPLALRAAGEHFVSVHAQAQNMTTIAACGNLAQPVQ